MQLHSLLCDHCARFGVDSLLNEENLASNTTIATSLSSNLKADLIAVGIDTQSAQIIIDKALSLSNSLEASIILAFSAESAGPIGEEILYTKVAQAFMKGAMQGIAQTSLNNNLKTAKRQARIRKHLFAHYQKRDLHYQILRKRQQLNQLAKLVSRILHQQASLTWRLL